VNATDFMTTGLQAISKGMTEATVLSLLNIDVSGRMELTSSSEKDSEKSSTLTSDMSPFIQVAFPAPINSFFYR